MKGRVLVYPDDLSEEVLAEQRAFYTDVTTQGLDLWLDRGQGKTYSLVQSVVNLMKAIPAKPKVVVVGYEDLMQTLWDHDFLASTEPIPCGTGWIWEAPEIHFMSHQEFAMNGGYALRGLQIDLLAIDEVQRVFEVVGDNLGSEALHVARSRMNPGSFQRFTHGDAVW